MAVTVNSAHYTKMLRTFLEPELHRLGVETHTLWFQQDGAMAHTTRTAMQVLNEMFPACVISRRGNTEWPSRSPDLNACNFFLWEQQGVRKETTTTVDLKLNIWDKVAAISPTMLRVMQKFQKCLQQCVDNKGCHLTDTIFRK